MPTAIYSTLGFLWYLITLFMVFIVVLLLLRCRVDLRKWSTALLVAVLSFVLYCVLPEIKFLNLSKVLWYMPFFLVGIQFNEHRAQLTKRLCGWTTGWWWLFMVLLPCWELRFQVTSFRIYGNS